MLSGQGNGGGHKTDAVNAAVFVRVELLPAAMGIYPASDARVGATNERHAIFNRAKRGRRGLLPLCRAFAEPAVVGDVHQKIGIRIDALAREMRENILETNEHGGSHFLKSVGRPRRRR